MRIGLTLLAAGAALFLTTAAAEAGTIEDTKARGNVRCGTGAPSPGFEFPDAQGKLRGFNIDFCRAVAAAVLGDSEKLEITVLGPTTNLTTLAAGGIDMLMSNITYTFNRDNGVGIEFPLVYLYDGTGFLVPKSSGVKSALDLKDATICVPAGSTIGQNVSDFFNAKKIPYKIVAYQNIDAIRVAYTQGRCDAWSLSRTGLAAGLRALDHPDQHMVLPDAITKEPLGVVVRQGDIQWSHLVKWAVYAMIAAEEYGITSANVDEIRKTTDIPEVKRLLGVGDDLGQKMGVSADWAYNIIKQVGNYGEIWDRNIGEKSPVGLARGLNNLYTNGGLMIAPAIR